MKKGFILVLSSALITLGTSCVSSDRDLENITVTANEAALEKEVDCQVPVQNDTLHTYTSPDGLQFTQQTGFTQSRSSVPNLYYDSAQEFYLLTFQSFENNTGLCDKLAYTKLSLDGKALESNQPIRIESKKFFNGFDPTIVSVNEKLVLVYTVRPQGKKFPCISLAVSKGSDISDGFTNLDNLVWCSESDSENYMDPSAVVIQEGSQPYMYVYTPSDTAMATSSPESYFAKIDISSTDPQKWNINSTGIISGADFFLLGEMVHQPDQADCPYAFYGTFKNTIKRGCSFDGITFSEPADSVFSGADPAVTTAPDGTYMMVYASEN